MEKPTKKGMRKHNGTLIGSDEESSGGKAMGATEAGSYDNITEMGGQDYY